MADHYIDTPPAGADGWRDVWREDRRYRATSKHEWLIAPLRKLFRRVTAPDAERQKNFNLVVLDLVRDARGDIDALRRDFRRDVEALQREVAQALASESDRLRDLVLTAARRNDALIAALDQKIETLAARFRDAVNPVVPPTAPDVLYRRLEDALRGAETQVRADVAPYVALAAQNQPVLDVGCGRGEFLAACRDANVTARGVDTNERSVADLKQRGFDVDLAGVPECFVSVAEASLGTVVAMHVVEHLPTDALFALFRESSRVLRPGGLLIIETPNAESMLIAASDFWRDPTHIAPRHVAALTLLGREHRFSIEEVRAIHPVADGAKIPMFASDSPELQRVVNALNERLFAPQDLRLVLRRD